MTVPLSLLSVLYRPPVLRQPRNINKSACTSENDPKNKGPGLRIVIGISVLDKRNYYAACSKMYFPFDPGTA